MPLTRSQIKGSNSEPETNQINFIIKTDKCASCENECEAWFKEERFNILEKCPCILEVCKDCSEKSFKDNDDEYCPLDKHENCQKFIEKKWPGASKEIEHQDLKEILNKINCEFNGKRILLHYEKNQPDNIDGAEEENTISGNSALNNDTSQKNYEAPTSGHQIYDNIFYQIYDNIFFKRNIFWWSFIFLVIILLFNYVPSLLHPKSPEIPNKTDITFEEVVGRLNRLEKMYSKQPRDLWASLKVGMRKLVDKSNSPTTILLLHSQNSKVNTCLLAKIKDITTYIASLQKNEVEFKQQGKGVYINMEDYPLVYSNAGQFMEKYKSELEQDKLLIVENFHKSPMTVMEAFHYLSDTVDPWVKNVLILLTLEIKIPNSNSQNIENTAERELRELLKTLPDNISNPLITRLTENVFMVADEVKDSSCSLS